MSIKSIAIKGTSLVAVLFLATSLSLTSCGKKDVATDAAKTATDAAQTATDAAKTAGGAATDAAKSAGSAATNAAKTATTAVTGGGALSAAEKLQLTPVKTALVMANTAVKSGDMTKAKAQFDKFSGMWTTVEPMVKAKAGASYPAIESGVNMLKTAMGSPTPDKVKAGEGLKTALDGINALMAKK
jgi:ethanolamine utilization microcompartment shell protein EutS